MAVDEQRQGDNNHEEEEDEGELTEHEKQEQVKRRRCEHETEQFLAQLSLEADGGNKEQKAAIIAQLFNIDRALSEEEEAWIELCLNEPANEEHRRQLVQCIMQAQDEEEVRKFE